MAFFPRAATGSRFLRSLVQPKIMMAAMTSSAAPRLSASNYSYQEPSHCASFFSSKVTRLETQDPRMSKIVIHNGIVYMSGQTDTTSGDTIEEQTAAVLQKVDDLLTIAGTSKSNLLTSQIWLKDIQRDFKGMNAVWNAWLDPENKPVRATVESAMARPQILVEIQVTATTGAGEEQ